MSKYLLADRVRETATYSAGVITLLGAPASFQTFSAGLGTNGRTLICATVGNSWLVAEGDYSTSTNQISNLTIIAPTGATTALLVGTLDVFVTAPAERLVTAGTDGTVSVKAVEVYAAITSYGPGGAVETPAPILISGNVSDGSVNVGPNVRVSDLAFETISTLFAPSIYLRPQFDGNFTAQIDGSQGMGIMLPAESAGGFSVYAQGGPISLSTQDADPSLNFISIATPGTISLTGTVEVTGPLSATSFSGPLTGNASTATTLSTPRTISLDGSMTGSASFDGSVDTTITAWLVNQPSLSAGTYGNLTISAKGLVTAARALSSTDVTTALGYTPISVAGGTLTGALTHNYQSLIKPVLSSATTQQQALGSISGAVALNLANGFSISATITGATTFTVTNAPTTGMAVIVLRLTNGGSASITWPASFKWPGAAAPSLSSAGIDIVTLTSDDAGASFRGGLAAKDVR